MSGRFACGFQTDLHFADEMIAYGGYARGKISVNGASKIFALAS